MPSLTRLEAQRRAELISVTSYDVRLDLAVGDTLFDSVTTVRFAATPGATTFVDVAAHELRAARLNGTPVDLAGCADGRLVLSGLAAENELVVEATMAYSHDGEGLHRHVDPADGAVYLYATSCLDAAPRWFACFDQPDLKARFALTVDCPPEWTVIGNAPAQHLAPGRWRLATEHPIATYFATLVAGPYHSVHAEHDGIRLGVHARASLAAHLDADAPELLDITGRYLDEFHRLLGVRYPWGEYHQAFVPDFNAGAVENPGCVTIRDSYVFRSRVTEQERGLRASIVSHEMAHMWFGDLVTMRWWDDLWLNESFAEYLGHRVCDAVTEHESWVEFGTLLKSWGYAADRRPSTHPIAGNGAADVKSALGDFDGISYAKGAAVLRQLAARLGDDVLLGGLRDYIHTHAYGNASFADLIGAWSAAGAHDLDSWAAAWLRTSGLDTLHGSSVGDAAIVERLGTGVQRHHAVTIAAFDKDGRELGRAAVVVADRATVPVGTDPALVLPDAADETWAKTSLDAATWSQLPALLPGLSDQLARVSVWNALRLAVADAEVSPALALDIVAAAASGEPSEVVLGSVLTWALDTVVGTYVPDEARRGALARLAEVTGEAMRAAPPASGRQLTATRPFVGATHDVELLQAWLRDESLPPGLAIDDELRWLVLERLAALGALHPADIDAELDRDRSAQGAAHAAKCRALRPDPEAKAAAWHALMNDAGRSNYDLYAIAGGFWHPEQTMLTAPFADAYFDDIAGTARLRSGWLVGKVALLSYPRTAVARGTIDRSEALLTHDGLDASIRRSVVDAADDLRRALASRDTFAE